jgi:phenylpropionate dioxygenase-like ring-hydroxylating dioxygenase large terminal subunit
MLSKEDNEFLCRVGPGTPAGEMFRRFWLPALLSTELPARDCPPVRLRILGEDLIAFRDSTGQVGVVAAHCPHRGASLFFGRNEEEGLRCVYHGWKFDTTGQCVDMPNEPAESNFKSKIMTTAYSTREAGGAIFVYMGPPALEPEMPDLEWLRVPAGHSTVWKWYQETNYLQGYEGDIDSSHSSFLHTYLDPSKSPNETTIRPELKAKDKAPKLVVGNTEYGLRYGARRTIGNDTYNWRVTQAMLPTWSLIPFLKFPAGGRAWIPVDDERTMTFYFSYHPERPMTDADIAVRLEGRAFPPEVIPGTFTPKRNASNDYLIDRELQRTLTYTGIWGVNDQDRAVQEGMGPIYDRRREHLGTADLAIITARRRLLGVARELQQGIEPYAAHHGEVYRIRAMDVNTQLDEFNAVVETHETGLLAPA